MQHHKFSQETTGFGRALNPDQDAHALIKKSYHYMNFSVINLLPDFASQLL